MLLAGPGGGGVIGGLLGAGILGKSIPPLIAFMLGGAIVGVIVYAAIYGFFICINPSRNRRARR